MTSQAMISIAAPDGAVSSGDDPVLTYELIPALLLAAAVGSLALALRRVAKVSATGSRGTLVPWKERARWQHGRDSITGLPDRKAFLLDLQDEIQLASAERTRLGVLCFRMINLPEINLLAGYDAGDRILTMVGDVIAEQYDRAAALSPGSFAVLLRSVEGEDNAYATVRAVLNDIQTPRNVDRLNIEPRCVAGLSLFPDHGADAMQLLRNADLAQLTGLELRRDIIVYSDEYEPDSRQLDLMGDFAKAIQNNEFSLLCQPKLDLRRNRIVGGEILLRWHHPTFGVLTPDEFVPLAEKTGFIRKITLHVIERVVEYIQDNPDDAGSLQFSINVAAKDISHAHFAKRVGVIAGEYTSRLLLEITETDAMEDRRQVLRTAKDLHLSGVSLSIDDFGTGYSSLSYLRELNPEELKVDRSFVTPLARSSDDLKLVKCTIQLAHEFGISVVAEGVEDTRTLELLQAIDCDKAQGYGISRPMRLENFPAWLKACPWSN